MTLVEDQLREVLDEGSAHLQLPVGIAREAWINGRRQRRRTLVIGCGLATLVVVGVVVGIVSSHGHDQRLTIGSPTPHPAVGTPTPSPVTGPVNVNGFIFTPQPAAAASAPLSAQEAYGVYDNGHAIPSGTIAQYGILTGGPRHRQAVWAYISNGGCWVGYGSKPVPTPSSGYCTTWTFLSPSTGAGRDMTQQD
jgi:hypothetical protein